MMVNKNSEINFSNKILKKLSLDSSLIKLVEDKVNGIKIIRKSNLKNSNNNLNTNETIYQNDLEFSEESLISDEEFNIKNFRYSKIKHKSRPKRRLSSKKIKNSIKQRFYEKKIKKKLVEKNNYSKNEKIFDIKPQLENLLNWRNNTSSFVIQNSIISTQINKYTDITKICKDHNIDKIECIVIDFPWYKKKFESFFEIQFPLILMKDTMIFIWIEKEFIHKIISYCEDILKFKYVENIVWGCFEENTNDYLNQPTEYFTSENTKLNDHFIRRKYKYFSKSKNTILVFRKV